MTRARVQLLLAVLVGVGLAACGGDGAPLTPTATLTGTAVTVEPTSAAIAPTATIAADDGAATPTGAAATAATTTPLPSGAAQAMDEPVLRILNLSDGGSITLPAEIHYEISGTPDMPAVYMRVTVEGLAEIAPLELSLAGARGTVVYPADKLVSGKRDFTFQLLDGNAAPYANADSRVTIHDVVVMGGR